MARERYGGYRRRQRKFPAIQVLGGELQAAMDLLIGEIGRDAFYDWAQQFPRRVVLNSQQYHDEIMAEYNRIQNEKGETNE